MRLNPGSKLGSYEILGPLGAGGMGEVYRARDPKLGRQVAIKVLPSEVARDPDRLGRFRREAPLLAALNHPHIASIHGLEGGQPAVLFDGGWALADYEFEVAPSGKELFIDPPRAAAIPRPDRPGLQLGRGGPEAGRAGRHAVSAAGDTLARPRRQAGGSRRRNRRG